MLEADWQATSAIVVCDTLRPWTMLHRPALRFKWERVWQFIHQMTETSPTMGKNLLLHLAVGFLPSFLSFSMLIVAGGKSAAEPGPQQMGKAFGKADMTWRFFEVHKDASTWCINHILMYFIRWVNVSFVTTTAEAMPKQHLQWSAFQQRRPRDAAISVDFSGGAEKKTFDWDCAEMVPSISLWNVEKLYSCRLQNTFDRSFGFLFFWKPSWIIAPDLPTSLRPNACLATLLSAVTRWTYLLWRIR